MTLRDILLPAVAPGLFLAVAATPVDVLGCRNRGLLALTIALLSLAGAASAVHRVYFARRSNRADARRWSVSALMLMLPTALLLYLA